MDASTTCTSGALSESRRTSQCSHTEFAFSLSEYTNAPLSCCADECPRSTCGSAIIFSGSGRRPSMASPSVTALQAQKDCGRSKRYNLPANAANCKPPLGNFGRFHEGPFKIRCWKFGISSQSRGPSATGGYTQDIESHLMYLQENLHPWLPKRQHMAREIRPAPNGSQHPFA